MYVGINIIAFECLASVLGQDYNTYTLINPYKPFQFPTQETFARFFYQLHPYIQNSVLGHLSTMVIVVQSVVINVVYCIGTL